MRLMRVFRILKLARFIGESNNIMRALNASKIKIGVFIMFILILCTILGSVMYLIESNEEVYFGEVFWTSDSEQPSELGEDGEFWIEYEGLPSPQPSPLRNLKLELEKLNVFVKNETLITSLRKLHGLHYITITTKHGKGIDGDDPSVRSEIRHISIYEGMKTRKIFRVWLNS